MGNIAILEDSLEICRQGYYIKDGIRKDLKLSKDRMKDCRVFMPDDLEKLKDTALNVSECGNVCEYGCENADSFSLARKIDSQLKDRNERVLVLNLANPLTPGGGVYNGACAQEEDLCRKSTLLLSLESDKAEQYYVYHRSLNTRMSSDSIIITPDVEIFKDENNDLLEETQIVSVLTCAAPRVRAGYEGRTEDEYRALMYNRINGILACAASLGFRYLVLGAFGCGAFGNDGKTVSDLFRKAVNEERYKGVFCGIYFAVLCVNGKTYNFNEFNRNFGAEKAT